MVSAARGGQTFPPNHPPIESQFCRNACAVREGIILFIFKDYSIPIDLPNIVPITQAWLPWFNHQWNRCQ
jgi:hypothetical protein